MSRIPSTLNRRSILLTAALAAGALPVLSACDSAGRGGGAQPQVAARSTAAPLPAGTYAVQQAHYDDATGLYRVTVLDAPPRTRPFVESAEVRMARLPEDQVAAGQKSRLEVGADGVATLWLTPEFQVAYVHNVTEEQVDPSTGVRETVVVRQEQSFWTPFAASMAGTMMANALFAPHYVYPPVYAGGALSGVGSYGLTRGAATESFTKTHGAPPKPASIAASGAALRPRALSPGGRPMMAPGGAGGSTLKPSPVARPRPTGKMFGTRRR